LLLLLLILGLLLDEDTPYLIPSPPTPRVRPGIGFTFDVDASLSNIHAVVEVAVQQMCSRETQVDGGRRVALDVGRRAGRSSISLLREKSSFGFLL
jgi:hypothetical protein